MEWFHIFVDPGAVNEYQGGTLSSEIITGNALDLHFIRYDLISNYSRTSITRTRITRIPRQLEL